MAEPQRIYTALVRKKTNESEDLLSFSNSRETRERSDPISIADYNKTHRYPYYEQNIVFLPGWHLQDELQNKNTNQQYTEIQHVKYQFVTAHINVSDIAYYAREKPSKILDRSTCQSSYMDGRGSVGMLSNFRDVTAEELFTVLFEEGILNDTPSIVISAIVNNLPNSLVTYSFLQWVVRNFSSYTNLSGVVIPSRAKIMTGAQFKKIYTKKLGRLLTENMNHNGFQWKPDQENICPLFCPVTPCNFGLYFTYKNKLNPWIQYNGKTMYYQARVTVPDNAIVKIEDGKFAASSLIIYKIRPIVQ